MTDPIDVPCPDCSVPAGTPCSTSLDVLDGVTHAGRSEVARLRSLPRGTCSSCGRAMVLDLDADGEPTARHYEPDAIAACPDLPDPSAHWDAYAAAINAGVRPGEPGTRYFIPDDTDQASLTAREQLDAAIGPGAAHALLDALPVCPDCEAGKHAVCAGQAWDHDADEPAPCSCHEAGHP